MHLPYWNESQVFFYDISTKFYFQSLMLVLLILHFFQLKKCVSVSAHAAFWSGLDSIYQFYQFQYRFCWTCQMFAIHEFYLNFRAVVALLPGLYWKDTSAANRYHRNQIHVGLAYGGQQINTNEFKIWTSVHEHHKVKSVYLNFNLTNRWFRTSQALSLIWL